MIQSRTSMVSWIVYWLEFLSFLKRETNGEYQSSKFKDIQKLIAKKLENPKVMKEASNNAVLKTTQPLAPPSPVPKVIAAGERKSPPNSSLPPPPPPPPRPRAKAVAAPQKGPAVVEFYNLLSKQESKRDQPRIGNTSNSAHNSIVGEIQNRSAHLMAVSSRVLGLVDKFSQKGYWICNFFVD